MEGWMHRGHEGHATAQQSPQLDRCSGAVRSDFEEGSHLATVWPLLPSSPGGLYLCCPSTCAPICTPHETHTVSSP